MSNRLFSKLLPGQSSIVSDTGQAFGFPGTLTIGPSPGDPNDGIIAEMTIELGKRPNHIQVGVLLNEEQAKEIECTFKAINRKPKNAAHHCCDDE